MKKVAIVGVEGSGKTVMLAGLGELYSRPDKKGCYLSPKNYGTAAYVSEKIARMRKGEWPMATADDEVQGLDWTLKQRASGDRKRPKSLCEVSFLDFAGEVYRAAYGISGEENSMLAEQVDVLRQYVRGADDLIVLINLRDVIANGDSDKRVQEAMWITKAILDTALGEDVGENAPRAAIVLSQADSYAETIKACGGAHGVLEKYLPHVANEYGWLDVFAASAVDKTVLDDNGVMVPASDFKLDQLSVLMDWIRDGIGDAGGGRKSRTAKAAMAEDAYGRDDNEEEEEEEEVEDSPPVRTAVTSRSRTVHGCLLALALIAAFFSAAVCFLTDHLGMAICFALVFFGVIGMREDSDIKRGVFPWLGCALLLLIAGVLGASGYWKTSLFVGCLALGAIHK